MGRSLDDMLLRSMLLAVALRQCPEGFTAIVHNSFALGMIQ